MIWFAVSSLHLLSVQNFHASSFPNVTVYDVLWLGVHDPSSSVARDHLTFYGLKNKNKTQTPKCCIPPCIPPSWSLLLFVDCLTSKHYASVSQERICSDNCTCCHNETEIADHTFCLTQSLHTGTGPTSPSAYPITAGAWQGRHWSTIV